MHRQWDPPSNPQLYGANCPHCPLKGATPVWGDGPNAPLMAFVGEAPGHEEVRVGVPFIGSSGSYFEALLSRLKVNRTEVWVDNAVACFTPGGDMKAYLQRAKKESKDAELEWHSPVDCCRPRLFRSLGVPKCKRCNKWLRGPERLMCRCEVPSPVKVKGMTMASVTVPMGNAALESCQGVEGITKRRGYVTNLMLKRAELVGVVLGSKPGKSSDVEVGGAVAEAGELGETQKLKRSSR